MRRARWRGLVLLLCLLPLLAGAAGPGRKAMAAFDAVHGAWASAMRWGDTDERLPFLEESARAGLDDFTLGRWEQVRISGYRERGRVLDPSGVMRVRVEVGVINVHTQAERTVVVEEQWQWLPEYGGWRLLSGLPALWPDA